MKSTFIEILKTDPATHTPRLLKLKLATTKHTFLGKVPGKFPNF